ncbi:hypothetical protein B0H19DRAFT_1058954 [Mycena capillaripes]|nr:hypothetical protein B0H19DRAFT_1058954 [Mycena capillaripes]
MNNFSIEGIDEEEESEIAQKRAERIQEERMQLIYLISDIISRLQELSSSLGTVFEVHFGSLAKGTPSTSRIYIELFKQIAAEESVLKMMPVPVLVDLVCFQGEPTIENEPRLLGVPVLYKVLKLNRQERAVTKNLGL